MNPPLSEHGNWSSGRSAGADWADVTSLEHFAHGTQSGSSGYDDSTALLSGQWGPNQGVIATVMVRRKANGRTYQEVELRLRSSLTQHKSTGYEVNCSVVPGEPYIEIVRWNGPLGSFTYLNRTKAVAACANGDVLVATMIGPLIRVYKNGALVLQATDSTYLSGQPGIGFYLQGGSGILGRDFGFSSLTVTDQLK